MRIVILTSGQRGIASYCLNLYKHMLSRKHDVLMVTEAQWKKESVEFLVQARSTSVLGLAPLVHNPMELLKKIREFRPDIIHYHWPCGTFDFLFGYVRKIGAPVLVTLHVAVGSHHNVLDKVWYCHFTMLKLHLNKIAGVNCISKFILKQVQKRTKLPASKVFLEYAGIDESVFCPEPRKENDTLNLLFVGQIMPEKGIDVLIKAVRRVAQKRKVVLSIVGSGHLKPLLIRATKEDACIKWVGFVKGQKEIASHYAQADLTVLPTRWDEAFSLVPVESLSCGTPVMATNKGGTPEIIIPGKTGYLLKECDEEEIYQALVALDKKDLENLRPTSRDAVVKNYSLAAMGESHERLYEKLIQTAKTEAAAAPKRTRAKAAA